jgi:hypothetical protein
MHMQCISCKTRKVCSCQVFKWVSSEGFRKIINREQSHPGVEGVQVGKFLNVWQIITFQIMCLALLVKECNEEVSCVSWTLGKESEPICVANAMLDCVWFPASSNSTHTRNFEKTNTKKGTPCFAFIAFDNELQEGNSVKVSTFYHTNVAEEAQILSLCMNKLFSSHQSDWVIQRVIQCCKTSAIIIVVSAFCYWQQKCLVNDLQPCQWTFTKTCDY